MHFVLVHGWGFNASIWAPLIAQLGGAETTVVDLGFVEGAESSVDPDWPEDAIAIGHSLGVLWLLKNGGARFRGLVSIQGFDRYCPHVPKSRVVALKRGIDRDPAGTMEAFWGSCGAPGFAPAAALNADRLREGLDWLIQWDAEDIRKSLRCPVLSLATRDDLIVPPAMTEAIWGEENVVWRAEGGHVLPIKFPEWCAKHVVEFANSVSP
ncbi:alpha/beta fold hydrolase [Methyloceanibacter sp. wino2]|uniref:alpha/beta fold hydrolase n=1 Tax=Methyloceanibacter sp. wino2 TaxID=2170729 RepID=UPI000D3E48E7|nr:alpha/beta fold hydrolase [Methyloceanibacter sp. wino2]